MSTSIAGLAASGRTAQPRVLLTVGLREAWRLTRHPVHLAGWALLTFGLIQEDTLTGGGETALGLTYTYFDVGLAIVFWPATFTFAATSLIATRSRRSRTKELLTALPTDEEARWAISCFAVLGPVACSCVGAVILQQLMTSDPSDPAPRIPSLAGTAIGPVCVLGAGWLAVLVARWLPWPMAPAAVMASLVGACIWAQARTARLFTPYADLVPWPYSPDFVPLVWPDFYPGGSMNWHLLYLLGLSLLAGVGVFLVGRYRWIAAAAAVPTLTLVITAGLMQLP